MPDPRLWLKSSIGTWVLLTATTLVATTLYLSLDDGSNDGSALTTTLLVVAVILLTARMLEAANIFPDAPAHWGWPTWTEIPNWVKSHGSNIGSVDQYLRSAFKALDLEGVTDLRVASPTGESALLMRISPTIDHPLVIGQLLPYLGADPLAVRTIWFVEEDESVVVVTFAREISQRSLETARDLVRLAKIARITTEEAARLLQLSEEELAKFGAYATA